MKKPAKKTAVKKTAVKKVAKKEPVIINFAPQLPKHIRESADAMLEGLLEICGTKEKMLTLINDPEHESVDKIAMSYSKKEMATWTLGYLRGIADTFRIEPEELLQS